jgi:hypothetical protein
MLALLAPYKLILEIVAAVSLLAAIGFGVHKFLNHEQSIGYNKAVAEYTAKQLVAEQSARAKEAQLNKQLEEAQNAATKRDQQIKILSDSVAATSSSLRNTTSNIRNSLPSATIDAIRKTADAALSVFGDCQAKYGQLAKDADGHANDVKTLEESWPK